MKPKMLTWILAISVIAVWGLVITRLVDAASNEDEAGSTDQAFSAVTGPANNYSFSDTFTLALNYRDPFTGEVKAPVKTARSLPALPAAIRATPAINTISIGYKGYVFNPVSKTIVAVMVVNSKERMMTEGETFEGLKLVKNLKDSVKVAYRGDTKIVRIN